mmetsp:Transcript_3085/g.7149  ORF Transcript_3085/g.7149 Transcript_3085/m.7149 type:complete len:253 (-) Transcript_3085:1236-1994(-)
MHVPNVLDHLLEVLGHPVEVLNHHVDLVFPVLVRLLVVLPRRARVIVPLILQLDRQCVELFIQSLVRVDEFLVLFGYFHLVDDVDFEFQLVHLVVEFRLPRTDAVHFLEEVLVHLLDLHQVRLRLQQRRHGAPSLKPVLQRRKAVAVAQTEATLNEGGECERDLGVFLVYFVVHRVAVFHPHAEVVEIGVVQFFPQPFVPLFVLAPPVPLREQHSLPVPRFAVPQALREHLHRLSVLLHLLPPVVGPLRQRL